MSQCYIEYEKTIEYISKFGASDTVYVMLLVKMRDVRADYTMLSDGSPSRARLPCESRTSMYAGSGRVGGMGLFGTDRLDDGV